MTILDDLPVADAYFARGDARGLRRICRQGLPDAPDREHLRDLVDLAVGARDSVPAGLPALSKIFAENILAVRTRQAAAAAGPASNRRLAGRDLDPLGERHAVAEWTIARLLNTLQLRQIKPRGRSAVVGTMRDDGIYALEWVAHYRALGFETLVVYSNDNADGSEHLLRRLADHGVIIFVESETDGTVRPEVKAFEHACYLVPELRDHAWVLFVDSDEFLVPARPFGPHIGSVLDAIEALPAAERPSALLYQWLWYNSDMVFERADGLLMDRFRHAVPHWLTKPMVRLADLLSMRLQHVPELWPGAKMVYSGLEPVDLDAVWTPRDPHYGGGWISHYWPKSFQEFSLKKARGDALPLADDEYRRAFSLFFQWNAPDSPETRVEPDPDHLARVVALRDHLRSLPDITALEAAVETRFRILLDRYAADGGLRTIYDRLKATTDYGEQAGL